MGPEFTWEGPVVGNKTSASRTFSSLPACIEAGGRRSSSPCRQTIKALGASMLAIECLRVARAPTIDRRRLGITFHLYPSTGMK